MISENENSFSVNSAQEPDIIETDMSEFGLVGIETDQIMFYNGLQEIIIHRTFKSPCPSITNAEIQMSKEITGCRTKASKIESNRKQLSKLCEDSWDNVTQALGK